MGRWKAFEKGSETLFDCVYHGFVVVRRRKIDQCIYTPEKGLL